MLRPELLLAEGRRKWVSITHVAGTGKIQFRLDLSNHNEQICENGHVLCTVISLSFWKQGALKHRSLVHALPCLASQKTQKVIQLSQQSCVLLSLPVYYSGRTQRGDSDDRVPSRKVSKKSDEESLKIIVGTSFYFRGSICIKEKSN